MAVFALEHLTLGNLFLALFLLVLFYRLTEAYQFRNMPPGPRLTSLPVLGNYFDFDGASGSLRETTKSLRDWYGGLVALKLGSYKVIVISDPAAVREVLVKKSLDYAGRPPFHSYLTETLGGKDVSFGNYSPAWKFHRTQFVSFLRQYTSDVYHTEGRVTRHAQGMLDALRKSRGRAFDPEDMITEAVANVICSVTFGDRVDCYQRDIDELLELNEEVSRDEDGGDLVFTLDFFPLAKFLPFKAYKEGQEVFERMFEILRKRLRKCERNYRVSDEGEGDFVGKLLRAKSDPELTPEKVSFLTEDYVLNAMLDMFIGGYETTTAAIKWAIVFMVHNPECQKKIQRQMDAVVGRKRMPSLKDRPSLPLVQAAILESLRLGNIADSSIPHYSLTETSVRGYRVPKDAVVLIDFESVHLNPECWSDPKVFDIQRHLDAQGSLSRARDHLYPFGAGRRGCPGEALATMLLYLCLSWVLHRYTLAPAGDGSGLPDLEGVRGFNHYPKPFKIRALKR